MNAPSDPFSLAGKHVLVTGASSGIGQGIALCCARMSAQVSVTGRHSARLQDTWVQLGTQGQSAVAADLTSEADLDALVQGMQPLHGLVHAAGISQLVPLRMVRAKHLRDTFESNTFAPVLLTQKLAAARKLLPQASIVFIAAVASHAGPVASAAYAASKAALLGASRSIAEDLARHGVRVNCIAPGYVQTPMLEQLGQGGANLQERVDWAPLGLGQPEDIGHAVAFHLCDASRSVNRSYFMVDGGISASMRL